LDPEFYKSILWIQNNDVTSADLTFSVDEAKFGGKPETIDLIPNGTNIAVTEENKQEYVEKVSEYKMVGNVKPLKKAVTCGFTFPTILYSETFSTYSCLFSSVTAMLVPFGIRSIVSGLPPNFASSTENVKSALVTSLFWIHSILL
jgi:hypothetical protein